MNPPTAPLQAAPVISLPQNEPATLTAETFRAQAQHCLHAAERELGRQFLPLLGRFRFHVHPREYLRLKDDPKLHAEGWAGPKLRFYQVPIEASLQSLPGQVTLSLSFSAEDPPLKTEN